MDMTGWTKYDGSGQPVPDEAMVSVILRSEQDDEPCVDVPLNAYCWDWDWDENNDRFDILYYKVVEQ